MITPTLLNNRYKVVRVLGSGGFGETFLAEDTQMPSGRFCVIKQLKPVANNPQVYQLVQERFQREAAILEELGDRKDQIPRLYAYFLENGLFYLVQEYIEGQTLTQKVQQQGVLSEGEVREIIINILPILSFVHSQHMVHRDIKPDNIILRLSDGKPILIDFGAVKETMGTLMTPSGNSTRSIVIGTPGFMPMEQSVGRPLFSSDIYSLGLTAIYLLTGKIPQELATDPATGELRWRHYAMNVSANLAGVLDKAVQQSPRDRYHSTGEMLNALQIPATPPPPPAVTTPPIAPSPPPPSPPPTPSSQNGLGSWQQAVIIGSVIGVFLVGGLWMMQNRNHIIGSDPTDPSPSPTPTASSSPSESVLQTIPTPRKTVFVPISPQPSPTPSPKVTFSQAPTESSVISRSAATKVVRQWLTTKKELFSPPYRKTLGEQLLIGKAYKDNISKTPDPEGCIASGVPEDDCLSSVDWLRKYNAYYTYGVQSLDRVIRFIPRNKQAEIEVVVTEELTFYKNGQRRQTSLNTNNYRYSLRYTNGQIKISDYKKI
ncbi:protein kinase domain-containing protein [Calothrix rhizosoleniae]|uniref:protein kinase domain-containing protein n=1 Tax=Calothrix rhizosoleniae TaxID=888997 RepID=UPI000B497650|nr:IMS domain-containing protein [Calothrix rhizosoleniae]